MPTTISPITITHDLSSRSWARPWVGQRRLRQTLIALLAAVVVAVPVAAVVPDAATAQTSDDAAREAAPRDPGCS